MAEPWLDLVVKIVVGIGIIALIWAIQAIIGAVLARQRKLPKDARNGIMYFLRIISGFIILFVGLSYFGVLDKNSTLSFTTIFSTAIGFSSAIAIGNLVAGFYLIASRPYRVGDYVQIGDVEGYVTEIGLNYTKVLDATKNISIRIPNKVTMNENLFIYKLNAPVEKDNANARNLKEKLKNIKDSKKSKVKYILPFHYDVTGKNKLLQVLKTVCENWKEKFGYEPKFVLGTFNGIFLKGNFVITADKMDTIQSQLDKFLDDIWLACYNELEKGVGLQKGGVRE
ncbi:MAG: mechanosensitive ion channel family protein [Candidatus Hodarchaeota archaeon]